MVLFKKICDFLWGNHIKFCILFIYKHSWFDWHGALVWIKLSARMTGLYCIRQGDSLKVNDIMVTSVENNNNMLHCCRKDLRSQHYAVKFTWKGNRDGGSRLTHQAPSTTINAFSQCCFTLVKRR